MVSTTPNTTSKAERWGALWGARPRDWAVSEEQQRPVYEEALARVGLAPGQRVLDLGCGTGAFLALVAERSAKPHGLDASEALLALARERLPAADLRVGDIERLPFEDDQFDLVTGFTSFFFADLVAALREAGRVAKPGAPVVAAVWGPPERNDLEAMKRVVRPFFPGGAQGPPLGQPGVLEELAGAAGLAPREAFDVSFAYEYPDAETLGRCMIAPQGIAAVVGPEREREVRDEIVAALDPFRQSDGSYRLQNELRCLVAGAP